MDTLSASFLYQFPHARKLSSITNNTTIFRRKIQSINITPSTKKTTTTQSSLLETIFNSLDEFICKSMDSPLPTRINPKHVLSGNFCPVGELPPTPCQVACGSLPPCLDGAYIRNGPNPQINPRGPHHFFDGDGMLHSIKISNGKPIFCSRYVKTYKHKVEREIKYRVFPSVFGSFNGIASSMARIVLFMARMITRQIDPFSHGFGEANTSLAFFSGRLFALAEADLPYEVKVTPEGDVITLGRHDLHSGDRFFLRMTAHPKTDRNTGETFAYSYEVVRPYLTYFRIDCNGRKQSNVPVFSMKNATVVHDFAVTEKYSIFPDIQLVLKPMEILRGRSPVVVDPFKVPRLGIIAKYAEDDGDMWWIDVPGLNVLHVVNAWEEDEGETLVMVASNLASIEQVWENLDLTHFRMERIVIDVKTKKVLRHQLSNQSIELGVVNPAYAGKKNRYVYCSTITTPDRLVGVVKLDLSLSSTKCAECVVASRLYGSGSIGGEPTFVPREPNNPEAEEDDGYLVTYLHDENRNESKFLVMDAKSSTLETVAEVKLPQRVPHGLHGIFVPENDLNNLV